MSSPWISLLRKDALAKTVFHVATFAHAKANKQHFKSHIALLNKLQKFVYK